MPVWWGTREAKGGTHVCEFRTHWVSIVSSVQTLSQREELVGCAATVVLRLCSVWCAGAQTSQQAATMSRSLPTNPGRGGQVRARSGAV